MAQAASSLQREPSMEEILASIRRIIEENEAERAQSGSSEPVRGEPAHRTVIEVDSFRGMERTQPAETEEYDAILHDAPHQEAERHEATLAEIQMRIAEETAAMTLRWPQSGTDASETDETGTDETGADGPELAESEVEAPQMEASAASEHRAFRRTTDDIAKAIENSRAAREDVRALLGRREPESAARTAEIADGGTVEQASPAADEDFVHQYSTTAQAEPAPVEPQTAEARPPLISERVERRVSASFNELSEAIAARNQRIFDEKAEEMLSKLLHEWMENNLPTLVERLVRDEIDRITQSLK